jgi:hypothetical protein
MTDIDRSDEVAELAVADARAEADSAPATDSNPRRSAAAQLVDMARTDYTLGVTVDGEPFGVDRRRPHIALLLRGGRSGLRAELSRRYFETNGSVPAAQALADAVMVLEGFAAQQQPQAVALRVAEHAGAVHIDAGDPAGRVFTISAGRWHLTGTAPVLFRRTKLTGELPTELPACGDGDLSALWHFVNVAAEDRPVVLAVMVAALVQTDVSHPILLLLAEQGSAKSSATRALVDCIDPSPVPLRQPPRDADGWTVAAAASWVVALDNLSGDIPGWLSDSLCRASTGDGSVKRALYTDSDVSVLAFRRCVIANGVDVVVGRGDLAERVAVVGLPRVTTRRPEHALAAEWAAARPGIVAGLLDLAAAVHQLLPGITVTDSPRMADFARVLAAVDEVLGTHGLDRYRDSGRRLAADTLDAPFIAELVTAELSALNATSADILARVRPADPDWRAPRGWPRNARAVTTLLTRHSPALRAQGWSVDNDGGANKDGVTRWTITPPPEMAGKSAPPNPPDPSPQVSGTKSGGSRENPWPATPAPDPPGGLAAGQAGHAKIPGPPKKPPLTSRNGLAGQAGHEYGASLGDTGCRHCNEPLLYDDDRRDGFHTDRTACLAAYRTASKPKGLPA